MWMKSQKIKKKNEITETAAVIAMAMAAVSVALNIQPNGNIFFGSSK